MIDTRILSKIDFTRKSALEKSTAIGILVAGFLNMENFHINSIVLLKLLSTWKI